MNKIEQKQVITRKLNFKGLLEDKITLVNVRKTGRNELCPCGSEKKFKNCCLND